MTRLKTLLATASAVFVTLATVGTLPAYAWERDVQTEAPRAQDTRAPRQEDEQAPRGVTSATLGDAQAPRAQDAQAPRQEDEQAPRGARA